MREPQKKGGDGLKFGEVVMATATASVVYALLRAVIGLALAASYSGTLATGITSFLFGGLVAGYVFAGKIREDSRMRSIAKIIVLFLFAHGSSDAKQEYHC
jgi:hypothetical protein